MTNDFLILGHYIEFWGRIFLGGALATIDTENSSVNESEWGRNFLNRVEVVILDHFISAVEHTLVHEVKLGLESHVRDWHSTNKTYRTAHHELSYAAAEGAPRAEPLIIIRELVKRPTVR